MSLVTISYIFSVGNTIIASQHNSNFSVIYNDYNGSITDANISPSAAIAYTKLALSNTIKNTDLLSTTIIRTSNGGTGTASGSNVANGAVVLNSSAQIPSIDGSLLTNITANNFSSILDYGTSASSSTPRVNSATKMAYGLISLSSGLAQITNLPFSSTSYYVFVVRLNSSDVSQAIQVKSIDSASAFTIRDSEGGSATVFWFAIGA